ncbi:MAG: triose-phosphate isomerase [Alphaproteobacteria bacterium]|nr:triose-phosphate isomerase [Alphaproteobacteria bacterium]MBV9587639.1 triose-phosphate isomerase [Alphaproteobacteria bacterium]
MTERKRLVAGNWKMNGLRADGRALARDVAARAREPHRCELLVCPPATLLETVGEALAGSDVALGGQDCHSEPKGAFTGCISAEMLRDAGCMYAIVGHSERRHTCGETDADVRAKTLAAWRAGLVAIVCVGETRAEREAGRAETVVESQLLGSVPENATAGDLIVAYEPVWAIGTGLTPTMADVTEMHAAIRARIPAGARILYGGSVNPKNAAEILALNEVDGALVGGASLKAEDFWAIAYACR